ncbi:hypothetical protein CDAR_468351 [Caerostris darwini]|uniref:Uncharacterized protein n=1 Tax=Caerostris darwini TaxID=1538125 RepID=A0AAV4WY03_9ARAC|nr:hypothetical protein CDAR_468351 [Caerostris darwini]
MLHNLIIDLLKKTQDFIPLLKNMAKCIYLLIGNPQGPRDRWKERKKERMRNVPRRRQTKAKNPSIRKRGKLRQTKRLPKKRAQLEKKSCCNNDPRRDCSKHHRFAI